MRQLLIYRHVCDLYARKGRAVSTAEVVLASELPRSSVYKYLAQLIQLGFVVKVARGWYTPCNVYQWHMDDYLS
jgi:DNA-binding IclR family transcriptional regulator